MKKQVLTLMMCAGAALMYPAETSAAECLNTSCSALGYSKADVPGCPSYIYCPFDSSYKACAEYPEEYPLSECPDGTVCDSKYKLNSCGLGYTQVGNTCEWDFSGGEIGGLVCKIGSEVGTNKAGTEGCYKTACKRSGIYLVIGVNDEATLADGSKVTISCLSGYTAETDSNGCIDCKKGSGLTPTDPPTVICPSGTFTSGSSQACACLYGITPSATHSGCYRCCSKTEETGSFACMRCSSVELKQ